MADITYDTTLTFCDEDDVELYGAYDWSASTSPTANQVYTFAQHVRGTIVQATERAGLRIEPPSSNAPNDDVQVILERANAIGAAFHARFHMALRNKSDDASWRAAANLGAQWAGIMGRGSFNLETMSITGGETGGGGELEDAIVSASNTNVIATDVTTGETTLKSQPVRTEVDWPYKMTDVE